MLSSDSHSLQVHFSTQHTTKQNVLFSLIKSNSVKTSQYYSNLQCQICHGTNTTTSLIMEEKSVDNFYSSRCLWPRLTFLTQQKLLYVPAYDVHWHILATTMSWNKWGFSATCEILTEMVWELIVNCVRFEAFMTTRSYKMFADC